MTQLTLRCLKYIKGTFNPNVIWHSDFLIPWQLSYRKRENQLIKNLATALFLTTAGQIPNLYQNKQQIKIYLEKL